MGIEKRIRELKEQKKSESERKALFEKLVKIGLITEKYLGVYTPEEAEEWFQNNVRGEIKPDELEKRVEQFMKERVRDVPYEELHKYLPIEKSDTRKTIKVAGYEIKPLTERERRRLLNEIKQR